MRRVRLVLLTIALGTLPPIPLVSRCLSAQPDPVTDGAGRIAITVRVYQHAHSGYALGPRARAEAGRVLLGARVNVMWIECAEVHPDPACGERPGGSELVLRVVDEAPPGQSTVLGTALVIPQATATFATVYARRVSRMARETKTDAAMLLGRVAAHELGHLLMNTAGHPPHGLMRPTWTRHEVGRNHAADWAFTTADMAAMRQPGP